MIIIRQTQSGFLSSRLLSGTGGLQMNRVWCAIKSGRIKTLIVILLLSLLQNWQKRLYRSLEK